MREGKWKLVAKAPAGKWELYDIESDRTEMHDLSSTNPDRTKAMSDKWEVWAKRTGVLPWPWKPPYNEPPTTQSADQMTFELKQGDALRRDKLPQVGNRAIEIRATIRKSANGGVIVAQGGKAQGYALYIKSGHAMFATRRDGELTTVTDKNPLPLAPFELTATLAKDGLLSLSVNGETVGTARAAGMLTRTPIDGLQVGEDLKEHGRRL